MNTRKQRIMYITMLLLAAVCGTCYHTVTKMLPDFDHPFASLTVSYLTSAVCCFLILLVVNSKAQTSIAASFAQLNWKSIAIGVVLVGVEAGIYYLYKSGSALSVTPLVLSVAQTIITVIVGVLLFKEKISLANSVGIILCLAGAYLAVK